MPDIAPEAVTAASEAIERELMSGRFCAGHIDSDDVLARVALEAAEPRILAPVYTWLVEELGFPFDLATHSRPPWLDVTRLAEAWSKHETDTVENYRLTILEETGWPDDQGVPRAAT